MITETALNSTLSKGKKHTLITQLKVRIKDLFTQHEYLKNSLQSYEATEKRLTELEQREKQKETQSQQQIRNKYKITRIVAKYNLLTTLLGIHDAYNNAFLTSSETRRALLTDNGCVLVNHNDQLQTYPLENYIDRQEELLAIVQQAIQTDFEAVFFWQGCEMVIPKNANIILGFNKAYPSVYIKRKNSNDEIFIEESAWHVDYVANSEFLQVLPNQNAELLAEAIVKNEEITINRNSVSISKKEFEKLITNTNGSQKEYQSIDMKVLEALEECDVVVQMPYITPRADMLVKVSFGDSNTDELILSTS